MAPAIPAEELPTSGKNIRKKYRIMGVPEYELIKETETSFEIEEIK